MKNKKVVISEPIDKLTKETLDLAIELELKQQEEIKKALTDLIDQRIDKRLNEITNTVDIKLGEKLKNLQLH